MRSWMQEYLSTVGEQIRWKAARPVVLRELHDHMEDQYEAAIEHGSCENEAKEETLKQMGNPVEIGRSLDLVHRPQSVKAVTFMLLGLLIVDLCIWLFVFYDSDDLWHWIWMPLGCSLIGFTAMTVLKHLN